MPKEPTLFMESTEVSPIKTAGEITELLVRTKAREIAMQYDGKGGLTGLRFALAIDGNFLVTFVLPVRVEPVYQVLLKRRKTHVYEADKIKIRAQAERVAWRQLLRWVQAQLAMIDVGMVAPQEVFLPYLLRPGTDVTLFEFFQQDGMKLLTSGGPAQ